MVVTSISQMWDLSCDHSWEAVPGPLFPGNGYVSWRDLLLPPVRKFPC